MKIHMGINSTKYNKTYKDYELVIVCNYEYDEIEASIIKDEKVVFQNFSFISTKQANTELKRIVNEIINKNN